MIWPAIVLVLLLVLPGALLGVASGLRLGWALAIGPALTFAVTGLAGWFFGAVGIAYSTITAALVWLAMILAALVWRRLAPKRADAAALASLSEEPGRGRAIIALPAIAGIVEQGGVPAGARVRIVVEAPDLRDLDDLRAPSEWTVVRLARPEGIAPGSLLSDAVRTLLADEPGFLRGEATGEDGAETSDEDVVWDLAADHLDGGGYAWLAGEASAVTGLRRHLVRDIGIDRRAVAFMGYWRRGRSEC